MRFAGTLQNNVCAHSSFVGSQSPRWSYLVYSLKDGCRLLFVCRRPPRIAERLTVSVFTPDTSQLASVHTYLRIS